MALVHHSKIDMWLAAVLVAAAVICLLAAFLVLASGTPAALVVAGVTAIFGAGLPVWLMLSTRYTLGQGCLLVRSGPFRWRIPLAEITGITLTSNPLSSPALSLDRLRLEYGRGRSLMISPRNREQFLRDIEDAIHRSA